MKYAEGTVVKTKSRRALPVTVNFAPPPVEGGYLKLYCEVPPHDTCDVYTKEKSWNMQKA